MGNWAHRGRADQGPTALRAAGCLRAVWLIELPPASTPNIGGIWVEVRDTGGSGVMGRERVPSSRAE